MQTGMVLLSTQEYRNLEDFPRRERELSLRIEELENKLLSQRGDILEELAQGKVIAVTHFKNKGRLCDTRVYLDFTTQGYIDATKRKYFWQR